MSIIIGCLVVGTPVYHVVADEFLLSVSRKGALGDAEQPAQVVVVEQRVAVQTILELVHPLERPLHLVEAFHERGKHLMHCFII